MDVKKLKTYLLVDLDTDSFESVRSDIYYKATRTSKHTIFLKRNNLRGLLRTQFVVFILRINLAETFKFSRNVSAMFVLTTA